MASFGVHEPHWNPRAMSPQPPSRHSGGPHVRHVRRTMSAGHDFDNGDGGGRRAASSSSSSPQNHYRLQRRDDRSLGSGSRCQHSPPDEKRFYTHRNAPHALHMDWHGSRTTKCPRQPAVP